MPKTAKPFNIDEWEFAPPPVTTAFWNDKDWETYVTLRGRRIPTHPHTLQSDSIGIWKSTGEKDEQGHMLYNRTES